MKKSFNYVLVITEEGPKYVTKINYTDKTAEWQKDNAPLNFATKESAQNLANGLMCNFFYAVAVVSTFELTEQPCNYKRGHFVWQENEKEGGEN